MINIFMIFIYIISSIGVCLLFYKDFKEISLAVLILSLIPIINTALFLVIMVIRTLTYLDSIILFKDNK